MTLARILGGLLVLTGLVLACDPTLVHDPGPAADTFAAVERRIPYGGVMGIGALLAVPARFRPWWIGVASFILWVTGGLLVARVLGLALDGTHPRQWMWVGVETAIVAAAALVLRRRREA